MLLAGLLCLGYLAAATGTARADGGFPAPENTGAGELEATSDAAAGGSQQALTDQAATSSAATSQQRPRNIVVSIRLNSPGDDGPIGQANLGGATVAGSNNGATNQSAEPGASSGDQEASTDQTADSTAAVTQDEAENIVISIRIDSPGDNAAIDQTNATVSISDAGNVSVTRQGPAGGGNSGGGGGAFDPTRDPPVAIGPPAVATAPPAQQEAQPPATTTTAGPPAAAPAPAPRTAVLRSRISRKPVGAASSAPAAPAQAARKASHPDKAHARPVRSWAAAPSDRSEPPAVTRPDLRRAESRATQPPPVAVGHSSKRAALAHRGARETTAGMLGSLIPPRPALQTGESSRDVSGAVVLTLIAVLGAFLVFAGSMYMSAGARLLSRRPRLRG